MAGFLQQQNRGFDKGSRKNILMPERGGREREEEKKKKKKPRVYQVGLWKRVIGAYKIKVAEKSFFNLFILKWLA